jgi:hypothetical protein
MTPCHTPTCRRFLYLYIYVVYSVGLRAMLFIDANKLLIIRGQLADWNFQRFPVPESVSTFAECGKGPPCELMEQEQDTFYGKHPRPSNTALREEE